MLERMRKRFEQLKNRALGKGYHGSLGRNGTEDEITIHAPDGREMAHIWFWDEEPDQPGVGDKEAKADGLHIIAALNAYRERSGDGHWDRAGTTYGYHASHIRNYLFEQQDAIVIHAPDGRHMAFIELPDEPGAGHAQLRADAQRIVDALNSYPQRKQCLQSVLGFPPPEPAPAPQKPKGRGIDMDR